MRTPSTFVLASTLSALSAAVLTACGGGGAAPSADTAQAAGAATATALAAPRALADSDAPEITPVGTPIGDPQQQSVGAAGGRLASADGSFVVDIPAGALPEGATAELQPVSNTAPGGLGNGLRLRLSALPTKPLLLRMPMDAEQAAAPDGLRLAVQRGDGSWLSLPPVALDRSRQSLGAMLSADMLAQPAAAAPATAGARRGAATPIALEFTAVKVQAFYLAPPSAQVAVTRTLGLVPHARIQGSEGTISICASGTVDLGSCAVYPIVATRQMNFTNSKPGYTRDWSVMDIVGGNSTVGTVAASGEVGATYAAPAEVPGPPTVRVSFRSLHQASGRSVTLSAKVKVVDDLWTGRISAVDGNPGVSTTIYNIADVTWRLAATNGQVRTYRPYGLLREQITDPRCTITVTPDSHVPSTDPRLVELVVDESRQPASYTLRLITFWDAELHASCPEGSASLGTRVAGWGWDVSGTMDGDEIKGAATPDGHSVAWSFHR